MSKKNISRRSFLEAAALGAAAMFSNGLVGSPAARAAQPRPAQGQTDSNGRVVLITGTSTGFGRLIALTLARESYEVHASMRHLERKNASSARQLERIAREEGLALSVVDIDVRSDRSVEEGVQQVLGHSGCLDVLVNNAGIFYPALLETLTVAQVQELFDTDVFGQLRMNRAVLPTMRDRGDGLVVQITSGIGRIVFQFQGASMAPNGQWKRWPR